MGPHMQNEHWGPGNEAPNCAKLVIHIGLTERYIREATCLPIEVAPNTQTWPLATIRLPLSTQYHVVRVEYASMVRDQAVFCWGFLSFVIRNLYNGLIVI